MFFCFFKQKTAYGVASCLVGSEMCIRDTGRHEQEHTNIDTRDRRDNCSAADTSFYPRAAVIDRRGLFFFRDA